MGPSVREVGGPVPPADAPIEEFRDLVAEAKMFLWRRGPTARMMASTLQNVAGDPFREFCLVVRIFMSRTMDLDPAEIGRRWLDDLESVQDAERRVGGG